MRTIIAGSRSITNEQLVFDTISKAQTELGNISVVICGCAKGVDKIGEKWAKLNNIKIEYYPADWDKYGKKAGFIRNQEMAKNADCLIAIMENNSKGTGNMIEIIKKVNKPYYVVFI